MTRTAPLSMPARPMANIADWAMVAAISYPPFAFGLAKLLAMPMQSFPILFIPATVVIALGLAAAGSPVTGVAARRGGLALALFIAAAAVAALRADMGGIRSDAAAMWRQLFMALCPAILFWGARSWASRRFNVMALDYGALVSLAVCSASIVLEFLGIAQYEAFGSRYFGQRYFGFLGDQVAWILSFLATYFFVRGRLVLFTVCLTLLLVTLSRGALFIVAIGVAAHVLLSPVADRRSIFMRMAALLVGAGVIVLAQDMVSDLLSRFYSLNLFENDRTRTTAFTLEVFTRSPFLGSGYNAHTYFFMPFVASVNYTYEQWATPVSSWAQILADAGLLGFIPFLIWALICCRSAVLSLRLKRSDVEARGLMGLSAWFLAYLIFNHSAAWLLPSSLLSPLVFISSGALMGRAPALASASHRPGIGYGRLATPSTPPLAQR